MVFNRIVIWCIIFFLACSCNYLLGVKDLGNGYFLDNQVLVYSRTASYEGVGINVVPPKIISVMTDENYIVAKTMNGMKKIDYWIIFKTKPKERLNYKIEDSTYQGYYKYSNVLGPLDVYAYGIQEKKLNLKFDF